mmetsp:Transcript_24420/g.63020  ORF Transcript_24420/g.63020 Transcript_24420/m.63020 type:complete len:205 (-) Transcript_24420:964-1578(-)
MAPGSVWARTEVADSDGVVIHAALQRTQVRAERNIRREPHRRRRRLRDTETRAGPRFERGGGWRHDCDRWRRRGAVEVRRAVAAHRALRRLPGSVPARGVLMRVQRIARHRLRARGKRVLRGVRRRRRLVVVVCRWLHRWRLLHVMWLVLLMAIVRADRAVLARARRLGRRQRPRRRELRRVLIRAHMAPLRLAAAPALVPRIS